MTQQRGDGSARQRMIGVVALGAAVVFGLVVVTAYVLRGGDDTGALPAAPTSDLPFGGTPIPDVAGMPTPFPDTGPLSPQRPEAGAPAPDFALRDARDPAAITRLSDYEGQPLILNFYASWCEPCGREMPAFREAVEQSDGELAVLLVNFLENQDKALEILETLEVDFPAVLDPNGAVADHYRVRNLPTTLFIDAEGVVSTIRQGEVTKADLERELAAIGVSYAP
jgi:cytochrome c biogenesis protein CcmG, thiol:disulfide interchange protein DsbE